MPVWQGPLGGLASDVMSALHLQLTWLQALWVYQAGPVSVVVC